MAARHLGNVERTQPVQRVQAERISAVTHRALPILIEQQFPAPGPTGIVLILPSIHRRQLCRQISAAAQVIRRSASKTVPNLSRYATLRRIDALPERISGSAGANSAVLAPSAPWDEDSLANRCRCGLRLLVMKERSQAVVGSLRRRALPRTVQALRPLVGPCSRCATR